MYHRLRAIRESTVKVVIIHTSDMMSEDVVCKVMSFRCTLTLPHDSGLPSSSCQVLDKAKCCVFVDPPYRNCNGGSGYKHNNSAIDYPALAGTMCTLVASSHHAIMCEGVNRKSPPTWGHDGITFEKLCDMGTYSEYICEMNER